MNAKEEFLEHTEGRAIKCASLWPEEKYDYDLKEYIVKFHYNLQQDYTEVERESFLKSIDFSYYDGFGGQELFGFIWYNDGTYSDRREYDGSEWWEHQTAPVIPDVLLGNKGEKINDN